MTEERARYYAEKLAFNLRITFYVVRSAEDEIYAVQATRSMQHIGVVAE